MNTSINFQSPLSLLLALLGIGYLLFFIIFFLLKKIFPKNHFTKDVKTILANIKLPFASLIPAICFKTTYSSFNFNPQHQPIIENILNLWLIASFTIILIGIINIIEEFILSRYDVDKKDNLKERKIHTQVEVIHKIIVIFILLIALSCMLMTFDKIKQLGVSLLASAGVMGIILGFAAQKSIATLFAGLQIALTQPIRLDDVVIVENEWGWIEDITLTFVVVRIWDLRRLVLPITYFIDKPFQNWTRVSADILGSVFIYTDYQVKIEAIRTELKNILDNTKLWDGKVWCLQVTDAKDKNIELRALMSSIDASINWDLRCLVREKLITFLQKNHPEHLPKTRIELNQKDHS